RRRFAGYLDLQHDRGVRLRQSGSGLPSLSGGQRRGGALDAPLGLSDGCGGSELLRFILRRTLYAAPSLLGLLIFTFLLIRVVPADPAAALAGDNATPQQIADIRHQYGFDRPTPQ